MSEAYLSECGVPAGSIGDEDLREKIFLLLKQKDSDVENGRVEIEKIRVSNEQNVFALEQQLEEAVKKVNDMQTKLKYAEDKVVDYEKKWNDVTENNVANTLKFEEIKSQLEIMKNQNGDLLAEKTTLVQMIDKLNDKVEVLNDEIKSLTKRLSDSNRAKCELMLKLDDARANETLSLAKVRHLEQEKDRITKIIDNLNGEMAQTTQAVYTARTEQGHKILDLQSKLSHAEEQGRLDKEAKETLQSLLDEREKKIENLLNQLKEQREANIQAESQFSHELRSQVKLANLYKTSVEESQSRVKELLSAAEEMQSLLKQSVDDNNGMRENYEREKKDLEMLILEKEEQIRKYEKELINANDLLGQYRKQVVDIDVLSPAAATASNLLKSGKSLTQIYSEYIDLSNQLLEEKETNSKLSLYLEQILKEVEEKAPHIQKQKENLEKSMESVILLSQELQKLKTEREFLESSHLELTRKTKVLAGEIVIADKSKADLNRQICHLLKEIEILKGRKVFEDDQFQDGDHNLADSVITDNLVLFKDITELQNQNQKLLAVVRELGESRQEEESEAHDKRVTELKAELEAALQQITDLRDERNKQNEVVTSIIRQRDMYRMMTSKTDNDERVSDNVKTDLQKVLSPPKSFNSEAELQKLKEEYVSYKKETAENIKTLNEELEKVKDERVLLHLENTKISSQLEFANDRFKDLQNVADGYKKEMAALFSRNEKLSGLASKHEEISTALRNEAVSVQTKLSLLEVELTNSRREKTLLHQSEAHLQGEIEALKRERIGQAALLMNLQSIQQNLESSENNWKALLKERISSLEREVNSLQTKLSNEEERSRNAAEAWEIIRQELNLSIKEEANKHNATKEELIHSYSMVHELRLEKTALEAKLKSNNRSHLNVSQADVNDLSKKDVTENEENLNLQLQESRSTIISLREQLKRTNDHLIQLKSMSSSLEGELSEQNRVAKLFKEETEQALKAKSSKIADLEKDLNSVMRENENLIREKNDMVMKNLLENTELQANLHKAVAELDAVKQMSDAFKKTKDEINDELQKLQKLFMEERENYQKEMAAHTATLSTLERLQQDYEEVSQKLKAAEDYAKNADFMFESASATWQDNEIKLKEINKRIEDENEELNKQKQNLMELLDRVRAQVVVLQSRSGGTGDGISIDAAGENSEEKMFDVIKFLRKEKEVSDAKCEVAVAENLRLTSKTEYLEKRLKETSQVLQESQEKQQVTVTSAVQHAELLRKIELLNVLTDGNRVLRAEKSDLLKQIKDLETKFMATETELTSTKTRIQAIQVERDTFQVERKAFEGEARRWQTRAQHLVEQSAKANADEVKRALLEKDLLEKQSNVMKEELARSKASLSVSDTLLSTIQKDLESSKLELAQKSQELVKATSDASVKDNQITELNKSLQQVRKIARKYKQQFDEIKAQYDLFQAEKDQLTNQAEKAAELSATVNVTEAVESAKQEVRQEFETRIKEAEECVKASEEKVKKIRQTAYQRITSLTTANKEFEDLKAKYSLLEQTKNEESLRSSSVVVELESCINVLKNDLTAARGNLSIASKEKSNLQKEVEELNAKLSLQQKQLEAIQKQLKDSMKITGAGTSRDSSILAQSSSDVVNPPTANIKPMATPSSSVVRHPHPSSGQSSRPTPMGRIRPISAVSPATSRTAAVPPTSASSSMSHSQQQDSPDDGHPTPSTSVSSTSNVPQATVAPTQAVSKHSMVTNIQQISLPHQSSSSSLSEDIVSATNTGFSASGSFEDRGFEGELGESLSALADTEIAKKNRDVESSSTDGLSSTTDSLKRPREDSEIDSSSEAIVERSPKKRLLRMDEARAVAESFPTLSTTAESLVQHRGTVAQVQATTSQAVITPSTVGESATDDVELEIIELESDDDSADGDMRSIRNGSRNATVEDEDDDEPDEDEEYEIEPEEIEEEFPEITGPDVEERFREANYEDDNDVEIIEDSETVARSNDGEQPNEAIESVAVPSHRNVTGRYLNRFPPRSERLPSIGRQQTVPCSSIGPPSGCEDGDSIVPSTPTLFDSRRNDGFAEAISSPQVPPEAFLFGNTEQPSQLASQALTMDDTRMDLAFDDGTGRSVPSTPHQVSPLDAAVTDLASDMLPDTSNANLSAHSPFLPVRSSITTEADQAAPVVPKITITGLDENTFTVGDDQDRHGNDSEIDATPLVEESTTSTSNEDINTDATAISIIEVVSLESNSDDANLLTETDAEVSTDTLTGGEPDEITGGTSNLNEGNQQTQEHQYHRRTVPIVWEEPTQTRRGTTPTRGTPGRGFARRSRPLGHGAAGSSRGGAFNFYRDGSEQSQQRINMSRGPRMGVPPGRGGRPYSRQRR
ncbi:hypothetical protein CHUAL_012012 [Chamberlinius hualienensis]